MPAYPYQVKNIEPTEVVKLQEGSMICLRLTLLPGEQITINMVKISQTQDFSVRAWVSFVPGGSGVETIKPVISYWQPGTVLLYGLCFYTGHSPSPLPNLTTYSHKLNPGTYYLNLLNLTNEDNVISGEFTIS